MEETEWDKYGTGNYEKCADCMVHCGYEATAVNDTLDHPLKALKVWLKGVDTKRPMAPDIPLDNQRPAEFVFEHLVNTAVSDLDKAKERRADTSDAA